MGCFVLHTDTERFVRGYVLFPITQCNMNNFFQKYCIYNPIFYFLRFKQEVQVYVFSVFYFNGPLGMSTFHKPQLEEWGTLKNDLQWTSYWSTNKMSVSVFCTNIQFLIAYVISFRIKLFYLIVWKSK